MDAQTPVTYSTVVLRYSLIAILMIADLNNLDVLGADIQNELLMELNGDKYWLRFRP